MSDFNPYEILGVKRNATGPELRSAKRRLQAKHHPDKGGDPAVMADINRAYDILIDPELRKKYDETGQIDPRTKSITELALDEIRLNLARLLDDESVDLDHIDLIGTLRESVKKALKEVKDHIPAIQKRINKLKKSRDRMKADQLLGLYDQLIRNEEQHLEAHLKEDIPMKEKVLELLADMKYEFDEIPGSDAIYVRGPDFGDLLMDLMKTKRKGRGL